MMTNKPSKMDIRVRYVKTQAVEIDCPAAKELSPALNGRLGEYNTTHEVFLPGTVVREFGKACRNPKTGLIMANALKQVAEAIVPIVSQSPMAMGMVAGAAEMMGNLAKKAGASVPPPVRTPPMPPMPPMDAEFMPPPIPSGEVDSVHFQNMKPKKSRKS